MLRDKVIYALTRYPGITEEIAGKLKAAGVNSPKELKAAPIEFLRSFGISKANAEKIKARGKS